MRSVSFVEHIELDFSGNLFNEGLLLEDIDNDGSNELVLGNVNGEIFVFKGTASKPWRVSKQNGMITCVGSGDLWNRGKKVLVAITADGWCHLFDIERKPEDGYTMRPSYSQLLPSNAKTLLIADIDGDGLCEMVTGHTDREVYVHRWIAEQLTTESSPAKGGVANAQTYEEIGSPLPLETNSLPKQKPKPPLDNKQLSKDEKQENKEPENVPSEHDEIEIPRGHFAQIKSWSLYSQITSLVIYKASRTQYLLVSQPGGTFINLLATDISKTEDKQEEHSAGFKADFPLPFLRSKQNQGITTTMVTLSPNHSSNRDNDDPELLAIGLLDGDLSVLNQNRILWTLHLEQNIFSLSKLDVTSDGYEEIIACAWDGSTYIIDSDQNIVKFEFRENVLAFGAGHFAVNGANVPCLVYVTFSNTVVIYWNITLSRLTPANLVKVTSDQEETINALEKLGVAEGGHIDKNKFQKLCANILYG
ncbi:KICSTOR complex protein ITFG2 [Nematostella vectensis]|uniref:KICSTOR complex protein ITFG2 n=1 Tax=Nematostella vectensis TaxID=45351 RepID=UPI0020779928|nr:KICSTOR complex protein ITFG2 [Nematostella vectensis]